MNSARNANKSINEKDLKSLSYRGKDRFMTTMQAPSRNVEDISAIINQKPLNAAVNLGTHNTSIDLQEDALWNQFLKEDLKKYHNELQANKHYRMRQGNELKRFLHD